MTEAEWLKCTDPTPMLGFLQGTVGERKLRQFSLACCHRLEAAMREDRSWGRWFLETISIIDRCFEGEESQAKLLDLHVLAPNEPANKVIGAILRSNAWEAATRTSQSAADRAGWRFDEQANWEFSEWRERDERAAQAGLAHDIFGNPFRPVSFSPAWRTDTALALARRMYDARDFSALPILADALQDAGCDNADILTHCRGGGPHVRGCWVVDLVLGKE